AALLYLGSGLGLGALWLARRLTRHRADAPLRRVDLPWLAGAITSGGMVAPVLLMFGLARTGAGQTSLLLNLEGVLTAVLAWFVVREHFDRRIVVGMACITAGALLLAWEPRGGLAVDGGALLVVAACLAWAVDNNLTRKISGGDALLIAALKGAAAGVVNLALAIARGGQLPGFDGMVAAGSVGFVGYGVSLVLFVRALRDLGAARTGAYFSTAPFLGALVSVAVIGEAFTLGIAAAGALMIAGVWLHVTERHGHEHVHEPLEHEHLHEHDEHHQHTHAPGTPGAEPHSHLHVHAPLRHAHPHYPDLHHRHPH
ncbi:MAG: DMT family transporter, partial [Candidatus Rokubacteria bacterium]|nr:DMT family transporter [Candidatus Rokubacteria bacterium]